MKDSSRKNLTKTAMMAAIVFVGIYLIKIPIPNGYTHLGDCFIFLGVLLLGTKRGSLAGAIGAAASDVLGGYMHWADAQFQMELDRWCCCWWPDAVRAVYRL